MNYSNPIWKGIEARIEEDSRSKYEYEKCENENNDEALIFDDVMNSSIEEILKGVVESLILLNYCLEDEEV